MKRLLLSLIVFTINTGHAQMVAYYQNLGTDTLISLDKSAIKPAAFYFPSFETYKERKMGYNISSPASKIRVFRHNKEKLLNAIFHLRYYAKNIKDLKFYIGEEKSRYLVGQIKLNFDGYQVPIASNIGNLDIGAESSNSLELSITYELADQDKPFMLVIGDFYVSRDTINKLPSPVALFQNYPFQNNRAVDTDLHPFDSYGIYQHFPEDQPEENYKGTLLVEADSGQRSNENEDISSIVLSLMNNYPFFAERKINKSNTIRAATRLMKANSLISSCAFVDTINKFLSKEFKDPHFKVTKKCASERKVTPVYAYNLKGKFLVAAVFDDEIRDQIPIGSEILAINNIKLKNLVSTPENLDQLLKEKEGTIMHLKIKLTDGRSTDISYTLKRTYPISENFKPQNFTFRYLNDSVAYYRVNKVTSFLQLDFINKLDSINSRKKLIMDLRSNGGGNLIGGARFAGYFINKAFKYCNFFNSATRKMDSITVKANTSPFHFRSDGEVVILIDEHTTCAAELIASTLRDNYTNLSIVGKSSSGGALAFVYEVILKKWGVTIQTNSLNTGKLTSAAGSLENSGINPDILVQINDVQDLQPYNDKVLEMAISK